MLKSLNQGISTTRDFGDGMPRLLKETTENDDVAEHVDISDVDDTPESFDFAGPGKNTVK